MRSQGKPVRIENEMHRGPVPNRVQRLRVKYPPARLPWLSREAGEEDLRPKFRSRLRVDLLQFGRDRGLVLAVALTDRNTLQQSVEKHSSAGDSPPGDRWETTYPDQPVPHRRPVLGSATSSVR